MRNYYLVTAVGLLAQAFFSARILYQWVASERSKRVQSPALFWILSVAGAYLLFFYGWLRDDFSIILGQFISFYIYIWNLDAKGIWRKVPRLLRWLMMVTPLAIGAVLLRNPAQFIEVFFKNEDLPLWMIVFGSAGQVIFTLRFIYQWAYSRKRKESVLPTGFWIISLVGSATIISYGILRSDIVLILGQSFGFVAYIRNLIIGNKSKKDVQKN